MIQPLPQQPVTIFQRFRNALRSLLFKPKTKEYTMTDITVATQNPADDTTAANPATANVQTTAADVVAPAAESTTMASEQASTAQASDPDVSGLTAEIKKGVEDFDRAFSFVEQGVALLGNAAKTELKVLAQKYL